MGLSVSMIKRVYTEDLKDLTKMPVVSVNFVPTPALIAKGKANRTGKSSLSQAKLTEKLGVSVGTIQPILKEDLKDPSEEKDEEVVGKGGRTKSQAAPSHRGATQSERLRTPDLGEVSREVWRVGRSNPEDSAG
ncbi:hypothetical protein BV898_07633 [Hypsibius exemplaris]|uniref:Uncharacterized protein n=1 Tax=Hypsibius exemplaris TaxID=2072580 RepID=A0A1W0WST4_HYPEX|nr:hypothetical protein BV898_07633 [Hypsibius exemplaris]